MNAIDFVHEQLTGKKEFPAFKAGDNITVNYKIVEGNKERIKALKAMLSNARAPDQHQVLQFVKFLMVLAWKDSFLFILPISNQLK